MQKYQIEEDEAVDCTIQGCATKLLSSKDNKCFSAC